MKKLSEEFKWYLSGRDVGFGMFWAATRRRNPTNATTRAKEIEEKLKNSQKRKLEADFSIADPALKHMKLKKTVQE